MIRYRVRHETVYQYSDQVVTSHNDLHLMPRRLPHQQLAQLQLRLEPSPDTVKWQQDYFGNDMVFFALEEPHERLVIRTDSLLDLHPLDLPEAERSRPWEEVVTEVHEARSPEAREAFEYVFASPFIQLDEALAAYARPSFPAGRPLAAGVLDLCHRIHADFRYDPEATTLETPLSEVLEERHGVCQDFAHVMIGALRSLGLPARYVSGYLRTRREHDAEEPDPEPEEELVGSEASHAWVAAWCPELGWIEADPTNDLVPRDRHIVLAWGRDYDDVSPVKGVTLGGGAHEVSVSVRVRPVPVEAQAGAAGDG